MQGGGFLINVRVRGIAPIVAEDFLCKRDKERVF